MTRHVREDFITDLTTATTVESARDLFTRTLEQLDVSHYAYLGLRFRGSGPRGRPFFITTYPTARVQHYDRSDYLQVDPVLLEAPRCITPMEWGTSDHRQRVTARQRRFLDEASDMGIRQGMAVPIHAAGASSAWSASSSTPPHARSGR